MALNTTLVMDETENPKITITEDDLNEVNQLSLACPICANPVERYVTDPNLVPVECTDCGTLYHKICWEQGGSACAMIGCDCKTYRIHAEENTPVMTINYSDLGRDRNPVRPVNADTKRIKAQERRMRDEVYGRSIFRIFFDWLLRQIRILDE